ncbi:kinase-like domain-containing protein [Roridomyces roridus]|uniref:Kinase-like domain-containing protein n=1 Tax=Roridomyces roridus TaxID=1738132 RepID=A0AAD7CEK8_9AGAR|nr:kinase-like domain-containing protein [Roridomyces roridus]
MSGQLGPVYADSIVFLKSACACSPRGRNELYRLQQSLDSHILSIPLINNVDAIVASLGCRKILRESSARLDLSDSDASGLRDVLRRDEKLIASRLLSILYSKADEDAVLRLEGDTAQSFLDVVQDTIDRGFMIGPEHSRKAQRIIRKLSESCEKLPSSLFVTGVTGRDSHPRFGGGFADVYRALYKDKTVALKHMRQFLRGADLRRINLKFCREALVWKDLHHPYILPFIGIDRDSFPSSLCMVSPWMEHGTVLDYLKDHGHSKVDTLLCEIAQGLQYLHSQNVVHGDLRGSNILINEDWSACLSDFGLSSFSDATTAAHTSTRAGSTFWMSPELISPEKFGLEFIRTRASDVYAFGCVCVELYTGRPPFAKLNQAAALLAIVSGQRPERPSGTPVMSDKLRNFISECWSENPAVRPTADAAVQNVAVPVLRKPKAVLSQQRLFFKLASLKDDTSPPTSPLSKIFGLEPSARERLLERYRHPRQPVPLRISKDAKTRKRDLLLKVSEAPSNDFTPPGETVWLFQECDLARHTAELLGSWLDNSPPERLLGGLKEIHQKCLHSQEFITSQIPWAREAERRNSGVPNRTETVSIRAVKDLDIFAPEVSEEERLLAQLLDASQQLTRVLALYGHKVPTIPDENAAQERLDTEQELKQEPPRLDEKARLAFLSLSVVRLQREINERRPELLAREEALWSLIRDLESQSAAQGINDGSPVH